MNQWLRALIALPGGPSLMPSTHMIAHKHLLIPISRNPMSYSIPSLWTHVHGADIYASKTPTHIK